ncbi:hypothetical protein SAMN02787142_2853 [Burkholderia sp. WP9]|uniref:hypothetical protein n=1 Tax=Burkholderia sp. WP9 TaxID=1500263 RepID=UPI0008992529|nr:hypothetical protein [Burkholderia sp. WP9]SED25784.1 hypothetical protein SAMN02787142_2853 [Burkholderia sp. WP9]
MEIRALPGKNKITFFEVQYFVNEGKQGTAKNVLLVTYSTEPSRLKAKTHKAVQHRVRFDLSTDREIYRKAKRHLGEADGEAVKQQIKRLKKEENIVTWFGIRQAHYVKRHKYAAGKSFHKRQLDPNNQVWVFIKPDGTFNAAFNWEGETISVIVKPHEGDLSENQSVGVGYYTSASADAELLERMSALKKPRQAASEDAIVTSEVETARTEKEPASHEDMSVFTETKLAEQPMATQDQRTRPIEAKRDTTTPRQHVGLAGERLRGRSQTHCIPIFDRTL